MNTVHFCDLLYVKLVVLVAGSSPGKPLWFEVQSALLPIIYELLRECIYPLLTPTVRLWILDVVDVAFFAVKTTDKVGDNATPVKPSKTVCFYVSFYWTSSRSFFHHIYLYVSQMDVGCPGVWGLVLPTQTTTVEHRIP